MPVALIAGRDGSCHDELLLGKGYADQGVKRRTSLFNIAWIDHIYEDPQVEHQNFVLHLIFLLLTCDIDYGKIWL